MNVNTRDLIVRQEQCQDLFREAERERLAGTVAGRSGAGAGLLNKLVKWFGAPRRGTDRLPAPSTLAPATGE